MMIYKLRTSKRTEHIFKAIGLSENLQPFILSKLAIALSIQKGALAPADFESDSEGLELNRQTIFGEHDLLFKSLITMNEQRALDDSEYFPRLTKAHLDRGATLLENEARYGMNFYENLTCVDSNL